MVTDHSNDHSLHVAAPEHEFPNSKVNELT